MKRLLLSLLLITAIGFTSCKKDAKNKHNEKITHVCAEKCSDSCDKKDKKKCDKDCKKACCDAKNKSKAEVYQCPMNCEEGKSYTKEGSCPVCKMALKSKKVALKEEHKEH